MAFASAWLEKQALFPELITEKPAPDTGIIVVVPSFDEPDLSPLLNSLASCDVPDCVVEVIIVVNAPANAGPESLASNLLCIEKLDLWKRENKSCHFKLLYIDTGQPSLKGWGVGLARKTGMDEALRRYNSTGNKDGLIVSLDADCTVSRNYFSALYDEFRSKKDYNACSIRFEHPLSGEGFDKDVYRHIIHYELHMRYYYNALKFTGFPDVFYTIGSATAFRASAYLKAGGMNRRQAGEDFYFIQKLVPMGGYFYLRSAMVSPSPRISQRVPFGTGATIAKLMQEGKGPLLTYNFSAFRDLKILFGSSNDLYKAAKPGLREAYRSLPPGVRSFIGEEEWIDKIDEINHNTSSEKAFSKRFFSWFNMFRIVKYLNYVHREQVFRVPVERAASELLLLKGGETGSGDPYDLLIRYRRLEND